MKTLIRFDLTRIFTRGARLTPTGVDRVDIRYAKMLMEASDHFDFEGVFIHKGYFIFVPHELAVKICNIVYEKWIDDDKGRSNHAELVAACVAQLSGEIKKVSLVNNTQIDARLQARATKGLSIYINTHFNSRDSAHDHSLYKKITCDKMVYLVYDLLPLEYPEYFWKDYGNTYLERILNMGAVADMIATISNDVAVKLKDLFNHLDIPVPHIMAIPIGVESFFMRNSTYVKNKYHPKNQFVIVSTIEPRKNHLMLLEIWRDLVDKKVQDIPILVIIGRRGWSNSNTFDFMDRCNAIQPYVKEISDLDDKEMVRYICESKATLFPTFGEGWGLPVVESMTLGVPAICSDIGVLRESSKNMAEYIDVLDKRKWMDEIVKFSKMSLDESVAQNSKLKDFKPITWEESFIVLRDILASLAHSR